MATSIREQIFANRLTALQAALLYTDAHPERLCKVVDRVKAGFYDAAQFPALYIYAGEETKTRKNFIYECVISLFVDIAIQIGNEVAETALNAILASAQAVMLADQSCGKLAKSCYEKSVLFGVEQGNAPKITVVVSLWEIHYQHHYQDPTKAA